MSLIGTSRHSAATQYVCRFRSGADINREARLDGVTGQPRRKPLAHYGAIEGD